MANTFSFNGSIAVAFLGTLFFAYLLYRPAFKLTLLDQPDARKRHCRATPIIGGIAMFLGFGFALLFADISLRPYRFLLIGIGLAVIVGVLDDFHELSPRAKLGLQLVVALLVGWPAQTLLRHLGELLPGYSVNLGFLAVPFTVVAVIGMMNAVNMLDGIDGLAVGTALIQTAALLYLCLHGGRYGDAHILSLLLAALAAFFVLNYRLPFRKHAFIFMGDAGSLFIGLVSAWFCIRLSQFAPHNATIPFPPVVFLWIMALPVFELITVTLQRGLINRRSPMTAGRDHLHYALLDLGLGVRQVTAIFYALTLLCAGIGLIGTLRHYRQSLLFFTFIVLCALYVTATNRLLRRDKTVKK